MLAVKNEKVKDFLLMHFIKAKEKNPSDDRDTWKFAKYLGQSYNFASLQNEAFLDLLHW